MGSVGFLGSNHNSLVDVPNPPAVVAGTTGGSMEMVGRGSSETEFKQPKKQSDLPKILQINSDHKDPHPRQLTQVVTTEKRQMRNQARTTFQKEHTKFTNRDLAPRSRQMHSVRANTSFGMNKSPLLQTITPGQIQHFMPKPGIRGSLDRNQTPLAHPRQASGQFNVFSPSGE